MSHEVNRNPGSHFALDLNPSISLEKSLIFCPKPDESVFDIMKLPPDRPHADQWELML